MPCRAPLLFFSHLFPCRLGCASSFVVMVRLFLPYSVVFAMEYLPGGDLYERLSDKGTLPLGEAVAWVAQAVLAIEDLHNLNIVHRDIKPGNLIYSRFLYGGVYSGSARASTVSTGGRGGGRGTGRGRTLLLLATVDHAYRAGRSSGRGGEGGGLFLQVWST